MKEYLLKKLKYLQLKVRWYIFLVIFVTLSACGDLVKESDTGACDSAIDARDYDTALSVCTSRKDKASAYMGKAGYDIINLLKSSGTTVSKYTEPTALGTDDTAGASILNILQLSVAIIPDNDTRATKISESRTNLDSASALLQDYLGDNSSDPLDTDEILLNTFAISFAMQLNQLELYDNATATTETFPELDGGSGVDNLTCAPVVISDSDAQAKLKAMDGHLWEKEINGSQCTRILAAIKEVKDNSTAVSNFNTWVSNGGTGALPEPLDTTVCGPISTLTVYLRKLALNITELGETVSLSGNNTKAITDADNSTKALMTSIGCPTS
ncbi:MAG: hypothetical protein VYD06_09385 [SAR324 cluster bacterium]|nr:hypothetical protein [SAR324 cluster bacterium]